MIDGKPKPHINASTSAVGGVTLNTWQTNVPKFSEGSSTLIINPDAAHSDILAVKISVHKQLNDDDLGLSSVDIGFIHKAKEGVPSDAPSPAFQEALKKSGFTASAGTDYVEDEADFVKAQTGCDPQAQKYNVLHISLGNLMRRPESQRDAYTGLLDAMTQSELISSNPDVRTELRDTVANHLSTLFHSFVELGADNIQKITGKGA